MLSAIPRNPRVRFSSITRWRCSAFHRISWSKDKLQIVKLARTLCAYWCLPCDLDSIKARYPPGRHDKAWAAFIMPLPLPILAKCRHQNILLNYKHLRLVSTPKRTHWLLALHFRDDRTCRRRCPGCVIRPALAMVSILTFHRRLLPNPVDCPATIIAGLFQRRRSAGRIGRSGQEF